MANYLMKYKGTYRILPSLDTETNDFPRDCDGNRDEDEIYISCQYGNQIYYYGLNESRRAILAAYIPSKQRGRNIKKELAKQNIELFDYEESDEEVDFKFLASDIEQVAKLLKAKTAGANISPFSKKNLPKRKDIVIPEDDMNKYKAVSSDVDKKDMIMFKTWNSKFLENVLQKKIRKDTKDKKYDYKADMKQLMLGKQAKEFIWHKGFWEEYLKYLDKEIKNYYNNK